MPRSSPTSLSSSSSNSKQNRSPAFARSVATRDRGCCLTDPDLSVGNASRILALSYSSCLEQLPSNIQRIINTQFRYGFYDIRNGLFLSPYHTAFDNGFFSIIYNCATKEYHVVALREDFLNIDGLLLPQQPPSRWEDSTTRPHPDLLHFHFQISVMKNLKAGAEANEDFDDFSDNGFSTPSQIFAISADWLTYVILCVIMHFKYINFLFWVPGEI